MHFSMLLIIALLLSGCATSPIPAERAKKAPSDRLFAHQTLLDANYGTLMVTRDTGVTMGACQVFIYIDGLHSASVWSGETTRFYLPVGRHIIGADTSSYCGGGLKEREQEIRSGQVHRMRISTDTSFSMDIAPTAF